MSFVETVETDDYAILHYKGRFLLYSILQGRPLVNDSFTEKRLFAYLIELHDVEDDVDETYSLGLNIDEAKKRGVWGSDENLEDTLAFNTVGKDCLPMPFKQFLAVYFQKGAKGLYRCEECCEVVKISDEVEEFAGNGGSQPVSHYCGHCNYTGTL